MGLDGGGRVAGVWVDGVVVVVVVGVEMGGGMAAVLRMICMLDALNEADELACGA